MDKIKTSDGLKSELQEQFQFILVDEYQDTNNSQNAILWHLSDFDDSPNIFVVGDADQSIYRFQGASLQNILEFTQRYPKCKKITLDKNYRSAQNILDTAYASVSLNKERLDTKIKLLSAGKNLEYDGRIEKGSFLSRTSELIYLVQKIDQMISEGEKPSEIAILVRENREVLEIATVLQKFGKFRISTKAMENIWEHLDVKYLILMLEVFNQPEINETFYKLLRAPFWNLLGEQILNIHLQSRAEKTSIAMVLQKLSKTDENIKKIWETFTRIQKDYAGTSPKIVLEKLWHYSGMAKIKTQNIKKDGLKDLQKIKKFFDWFGEIEKTFPNADVPFVLERIHLHQELNVPIYPDPLPEDRNAVQIMTAHRSKGMEFNHVFIPGILDKVWGNKTNRDILKLPQIFHSDHDPNEDERRLFFVSLTRAKKTLFLSHTQTDFQGRDKMVSQFLTEIPEHFLTEIETESLEEKSHKFLPLFLSPTSELKFTNEEKGQLQKMAQNFIWSASSLQTFIECPLKFYYLNFLKIPTPPIKVLGLGSAFHEVLEKISLFMAKSSSQEINDGLIEDVFKQALSRQNFSSNERKDAFAHGFEILKNYFHYYREGFKKAGFWKIEASFKAVVSGIPIYGKIDKIEVSEDQKKAVIIDYKSGKPKNIKSGERLWRQLVFYDILVRNAQNASWEIENIYLDFLTPKPNGDFEKKSLNITDEDRNQVLEELKDAHKKLQNLDFPIVENKENDPDINYWQNFGGN